MHGAWGAAYDAYLANLRTQAERLTRSVERLRHLAGTSAPSCIVGNEARLIRDAADTIVGDCRALSHLLDTEDQKR